MYLRSKSTIYVVMDSDNRKYDFGRLEQEKGAIMELWKNHQN